MKKNNEENTCLDVAPCPICETEQEPDTVLYTVSGSCHLRYSLRLSDLLLVFRLFFFEAVCVAQYIDMPTGLNTALLLNR